VVGVAAPASRPGRVQVMATVLEWQASLRSEVSSRHPYDLWARCQQRLQGGSQLDASPVPAPAATAGGGAAGAAAAAEGRSMLLSHTWSRFSAVMLLQQAEKELEISSKRCWELQQELMAHKKAIHAKELPDDPWMGKAATIQVACTGSSAGGKESTQIDTGTTASSSSTAPPPAPAVPKASSSSSSSATPAAEGASPAGAAAAAVAAAAAKASSEASSAPPPPMRRGMTMPAIPKCGPPLPKGGMRGARPPGPPPIPKAKSMPAPGGGNTPTSARTPPSARVSNGLVNINWRAAEPPPPPLQSLDQDNFLGPLGKHVEKQKEVHQAKEPATVFQPSEEVRVAQLTQAQLMDWWRAIPAEKGFPGITRSRSASSVVQNQLLDPQMLQALGILMQRYKHRVRGSVLTGEDLASSFQRDLFACNHGLETLQSLHNLVTTNTDACSRLRTWVLEHGEAALKNCEHGAQLQLLHGVLKVPQIDARLQCMIFEASWPEMLRKADEDLTLIDEALKVIRRKGVVMRKFLRTAMKLGNALNKGSFAPVVERGFRLSTWRQMVTVKCTSRARTSMLHMVLACMWPDDVVHLGRSQEILSDACNKTASAQESCLEIASSQVRISKLLQSVSKADGGSHTDSFQQRMQKFATSSKTQTAEVLIRCKEVMKEYHSISTFYEEPAAFFPPPRKDTDPTMDLIKAFHELVESVSRAGGELKELGLRRELADKQVGPVTSEMLDKEDQESGAKKGLFFQRSRTDLGGGDQTNKVVQRLQSGMAAADNDDAQSDVSDWSPGPPANRAATTGDMDKASPTKPRSPRRPRSPPSTPGWSPDASPMHPSSSSTFSLFKDDIRAEPSASNNDPRPPRKSLTAMADRVEQAALRRMSKAESMQDSDAEDSSPRVPKTFSPTRRRPRARQTVGGSPTGGPPKRPVRRTASTVQAPRQFLFDSDSGRDSERRVSSAHPEGLDRELKDAVRRRSRVSFGPGAMDTPSDTD